jgi:hypothetical protein
LWLAPRAGNGEGLESILPAAVIAVLFAVLLVRLKTRGVAAEATT